MDKAVVITTINEKTEAVKRLEMLDEWHVILVGDRKSKHIDDSENLTFLSVDDQLNFDFDIVNLKHLSDVNFNQMKNSFDLVFHDLGTMRVRIY